MEAACNKSCKEVYSGHWRSEEALLLLPRHCSYLQDPLLPEDNGPVDQEGTHLMSSQGDSSGCQIKLY